jgi:hypothetical protein
MKFLSKNFLLKYKYIKVYAIKTLITLQTLKIKQTHIMQKIHTINIEASQGSVPMV